MGAQAECDELAEAEDHMSSEDFSNPLDSTSLSGSVVAAPVYFGEQSLWFQNVPQQLRVAADSFCEVVRIDTDVILQVVDLDTRTRARYRTFREAVVKYYKNNNGAGT